MTTAAGHQEQLHTRIGVETFDPDDVGSRSPLMEVAHPILKPSPGTPPLIPANQILPRSGEDVLVRALDEGRNPEIAQAAACRPLPDDADDDLEEDGTSELYRCLSVPRDEGDDCPVEPRSRGRAPISSSDVHGPSFQQLTADVKLPPYQPLPKSSQILPSIRTAISCHIASEPPTPADIDSVLSHGSRAHFTPSPPGALRQLPPIPSSQMPPSILSDTSQLSLLSPHTIPATSPNTCHTSNGLNHRPSTEYGTSLPSETSSSEHYTLTPAASFIEDRMSIDGITNPSSGQYVCTFEGCTAPPFQTQYLLNSHANVHSSARPHYCPVPSCPRSKGGKGFKRKNEMIRHGLVHASPGYVCPFCPDKEHKYPRPDNLQRHVRVHHVDKDKDDPLLREVLSHRPDGPNRGRRRRAIVP